MKREEFKKRFAHTLDEMYKIMEAKNKDYTTGDDPFSNFKTAETMGITTTEKAILVRMSDKMSRICNLVDKEAEVKDESVSDTLSDLANYSIILKLFIESKNRGEKII